MARSLYNARREAHLTANTRITALFATPEDRGRQIAMPSNDNGERQYFIFLCFTYRPQASRLRRLRGLPARFDDEHLIEENSFDGSRVKCKKCGRPLQVWSETKRFYKFGWHQHLV